MKMFKKNDGFTLVELIVVIAILAILAGVGVAGYSGYIAKANDAAVTTDLAALKTAVQAANATSGAITKIQVSADGKTVEVTSTSYNDDFAADFATYYGTAATWNKTTHKLSFTNAAIVFSSTSYSEKGATWNGSKWVVSSADLAADSTT